MRTFPIVGLRTIRTALLLSLLAILPLLVKFPLLVGRWVADPRMDWSGLAVAKRSGVFWGQSTIDFNVAATSHALGSLAAADVLAGRWPWWNPYEGIGMPLAGEMQSAALFPLTWLMVLPAGQLYEHLILQIIAGFGTYCLLRKLLISPFSAFCAASVFEFQGMFAWQANAVINPVPFLPWLLLGIEMTREELDGRAGMAGVALIAASIAASLYAGFPETAFLSGLLALAWMSVRAIDVANDSRALFLLRAALGGVAGACLAAPILIPFLGFLPFAELGGHTGAGFSNQWINPAYFYANFFPYANGLIGVNPEGGLFWSKVGSYTGVVPALLAIVGLRSKTPFGLRALTAGWVVVALAVSYGAPIIAPVLTSIPPFSIMATYRYVPGTTTLSLCVLSGFALDEIRRGTNVYQGRLAVAAVTSLIAASLLLAWSRGGFLSHRIGSLTWGGIVLGVVTGAVLTTRGRGQLKGRLLGTVLVLEALMLFSAPVLCTSRGGTLEEGGINFLRNHLGLQRFATLGPIFPNYGSYYGLANVNYDDLPVSKVWVRHVSFAFDPNTSPIMFDGQQRIDPRGQTGAQALITHLDGFAQSGVRYVVTPAKMTIRGWAQVYADQAMRVYRITGTRPYFSAYGCKVEAQSRNEVHVTCPHPSLLTRLEANLPGWAASIDGRQIEIGTDPLFQTISLPSGNLTVRFTYRPPYILFSPAIVLLGICLVVAAGQSGVRRPRYGTYKGSSARGLNSPDARAT